MLASFLHGARCEMLLGLPLFALFVLRLPSCCVSPLPVDMLAFYRSLLVLVKSFANELHESVQAVSVILSFI